MSYDDKQGGAILKACMVCRRAFYFTDHSQDTCVRCREKAAK